MNTAHIRQLVLNRRLTRGWCTPGRLQANGALAEAVDNVAEPLLAAAEYGAARKARQAGYARKHRRSTKAERELRRAVRALLIDPTSWNYQAAVNDAMRDLRDEARFKLRIAAE